MGEYIRKVPYFNEYEKKKDFLKHPPVKEDDNDYEASKLRDKKNDIQYVIKKKQNIKDIFNYAPDPNMRTRNDVLNERKNELKDELNKSYYSYNKKNPFFVDTIVKREEETKSMKDVLNNKYVSYEVNHTKINDNVFTKSALLDERKKQFLKELRKNNFEDECTNITENIYLNPIYNYRDVIKDKNKDLTLKNYGFWNTPSDFVFSYPHVRAKGKGGWATDIVKAYILENKKDNMKKMNEDNIQRGFPFKDFNKKKDNEIGERIFSMKNRFQFINYSKNHCSAENYFKGKTDIIVRHGGFQKWTS